MTTTYEVVAVRYATRNTRAAEMYLNFQVYGVPDYDVRLDYFFWVAHNSNHIVVVDTGFTPEIGERRGRSITCPVPDGLKRLGIDPEHVETVVITHGHYDHTGNASLFSKARFVMSATELSFWSGPMARRPQFRHSAESRDIEHLLWLEQEGKLERIAGTQSIAPGISAIEVGGHTPGQLIVIIDGEGGPVLLTSDAVHFYDEVDLDRPFRVVADLPQMYRAFDIVSGLATQPRMRVVAGHDPSVFERFEALSSTDPGLGVRIR